MDTITEGVFGVNIFYLKKNGINLQYTGPRNRPFDIVSVGWHIIYLPLC